MRHQMCSDTIATHSIASSARHTNLHVAAMYAGCLLPQRCQHLQMSQRATIHCQAQHSAFLASRTSVQALCVCVPQTASWWSHRVLLGHVEHVAIQFRGHGCVDRMLIHHPACQRPAGGIADDVAFIAAAVVGGAVLAAAVTPGGSFLHALVSTTTAIDCRRCRRYCCCCCCRAARLVCCHPMAQ